MNSQAFQSQHQHRPSIITKFRHETAAADEMAFHTPFAFESMSIIVDFMIN